MTAKPSAQVALNYLDFQADVGITKHNGGYEATNDLLSLCHIQDAHDVLNVGCGIGVASAYIAKKHGCHVVGVDMSEKMVEWSRRRAREECVEDRVEFHTANVLALPFEGDRFDVVFCESVLAFVEDKPRAIRECMRVAKPDGYVGLNETFWIDEAPPELVARAQASLGTDVPTASTWQALWEASALREKVVRLHTIQPRREVKDRIQWVGWRWAVRAWGRLLGLYITKPAVRQSIREMFDAPLEVVQMMGYGLFVGRK